MEHRNGAPVRSGAPSRVLAVFERLILSSLLPVQGFRLKETLAVDPSG
jgi:hypothetical protein